MVGQGLAPQVEEPDDLTNGLRDQWKQDENGDGNEGLPPHHKHQWWDDEDDRELARQTPVRKQLSVNDPSLNQTLISSGTSISQLFDQDAWERHRSIRRYFTNLISIRNSTVFRRIFKPCVVLTALAAALSIWNGMRPPHLPQLALASTAHNLLGAAISLLLVFRTNASYARFMEGRQLWGGVVKICRDGLHLAAAYCPHDALPRLVAYFQAFPWVLKVTHFVRLVVNSGPRGTSWG